jgi:hypothetical protein
MAMQHKDLEDILRPAGICLSIKESTRAKKVARERGLSFAEFARQLIINELDSADEGKAA